MAVENNALRCTREFDEFTRKVRVWLDKQEELTSEEVTPERIEEITRLFDDIQGLGRDFAKCEFAPKKE